MSDQKRNDGGPAFPEVYSDIDYPDRDSDREPVVEVCSRGGMSLRDYFAAKAMQSMASNEVYVAFMRGFVKGQRGEEGGRDGRVHMAEEAYRIADVMLKAREAQ